jgi:hypothetical protein
LIASATTIGWAAARAMGVHASGAVFSGKG